MKLRRDYVSKLFKRNLKNWRKKKDKILKIWINLEDYLQNKKLKEKQKYKKFFQKL